METITYDLLIKTSDRNAEGSTDATLSIQLVGENGSKTKWHVLNEFWRDDFESGQTDDFKFDDINVGRILIVKIKLQHGYLRKDIWACDNIKITYSSHTDEFPVYDWVFDIMEVIRGDALLPNKIKSETLEKVIEGEIDLNHKRFAWENKSKPGDPGWLLPRYQPAKNLHDVPHFMKMEDERFKKISSMKRAAEFNVVVQTLKGLLIPIKKLDDYKKLFGGHFRISEDILPCIERWEEDEEQGRQMLNGTSPFALSRCTKIPEYCNITNKHVEGLLDCGKTLEDEIKAGKIYINDYTMMTKGLPRNKQFMSGKPLYCADVVCLSYSSSDGKFRPIAIQLEPDKEESIFTRNDERYDWMLAKMYFRCADTIVHQWIYHYVWGHATVETSAIALFRNLSRTHPIYKLVRPHVQHVVVIGQFARDLLIFDNAPSNYTRSINGSAMARHVFKNTYDFEDFSFPKLMKKRGLDNREILQNYHYRDDATMLWQTILKYISKVVNIYYKSDEEIVNDKQIQNWILDFATNGIGWADGNTRGVPKGFNTIDDLIQFVTAIVFTSTVQHSACHNGMFDMYKFIPNAPGGLRLPVHKKGEGSLQRVLDTLPDVTMATILFGGAFTLTELPEDETYLGDFPMKLFIDPKPLEVLKEFKEDLKLVSEKIKERNKKLEVPYEYLLPERIPTGTTA